MTTQDIFVLIYYKVISFDNGFSNKNHLIFKSNYTELIDFMIKYFAFVCGSPVTSNQNILLVFR